jgi:hypothetical protein
VPLRGRVVGADSENAEFADRTTQAVSGNPSKSGLAANHNCRPA